MRSRIGGRNEPQPVSHLRTPHRPCRGVRFGPVALFFPDGVLVVKVLKTIIRGYEVAHLAIAVGAIAALLFGYVKAESFSWSGFGFGMMVAALYLSLCRLFTRSPNVPNAQAVNREGNP